MVTGINFYHYGLIIFSIVSLALILSSVFNKKLTQTLATAILLIIFYLYWWAIFDELHFGYTSLITFISIGFLLCLFIKRKQLLTFISISFFVYIILNFVIAIIFHDYFLHVWSEFSHWGITAKDMFFQESIIPRDYNDYPIGTRLFQYFILKIYGTFNESILLTYFYIIYFAFIIYPLTEIEKYPYISRYLIILLYGILSLLFPFCFTENLLLLFKSLLVDFLLGMTFGFTIFVISTQKRFDSHSKLLLFLLLFFLVQIKIVGLMFAVTAVLLIFLKDRNLKRGLFFVIPVVLSKLSWLFYIKYYDYSNYLINNLYNSHAKILSMNHFLNDYWQGLVERDIFLYLSPINLMLITSGFALYFIIFHKNLRAYIIKLYLLYFTLFIIYNFGLYGMYIRAFSTSEKVQLASFERYQVIFYGGVIFILFLYLPKVFIKFKNHIILLLGFNIICGVFTYHVYKNHIKIPDRYYKQRIDILEIKEHLPKNFANKKIVIFSGELERLMLRFETGINIFTADTDIKPDILVIVDKDKYQREILDFIKLHKLNIKFENINKFVIIP